MTVHLDPASAALVVPGKTGFNGLAWGIGPDDLITAVNGEGVATLSRPIKEDLAAGPHYAMLLRYAPFENPKLANGERNPVFQETLTGWLNYVATVNAEATKVLGAGNYDLEVWNELDVRLPVPELGTLLPAAQRQNGRSRKQRGSPGSGPGRRAGRRRNP